MMRMISQRAILHGIMLGLLASATPAREVQSGDLRRIGDEPVTESLTHALVGARVDDREVAPLAGGGELPLSSLWLQRDKLQPADGAAGVFDGFGGSVALDGDTVLVLACTAPGGSSAYVYTRTSDVLTRQAKLTPLAEQNACGDLIFGVGFGSVALSGDSALLGLSGINGPDGGSAFVYVRSGDEWIEQAELVPSGSAVDDNLGFAAALDGDTALIGAPGGDEAAAYVFTRSGDAWTEQAKLTGDPAPPGASTFGSAVALDGDTALVADEAQSNTVHVFARDGDDWSEEAVLTCSSCDPEAPGTGFGTGVALEGSGAVVGGGAIDGENAILVFARTGDEWAQEATIEPPIAACSGESVDMQGETILLGGGGGIGGDPESRAVCVYARDAGIWALQDILQPADAASPSAERFGERVALDDDTVVVGTFPFNILEGLNDGAAYVFDTRPPAPAIGLEPRADVDFGEVYVGETSDRRVFTLQNNGSADLTIDAPILNGEHVADFHFETNEGDCVGTVPISPGSSCRFWIRFEPVGLGSRTASVEIESNAPTTLERALQGMGLAKPPTIDVDPDRFSTTLAPGGTSQSTMVVSNTGFPDDLEWQIVADSSFSSLEPLRPRRPVTAVVTRDEIGQAGRSRLRTNDRGERSVATTRAPGGPPLGDGMLTITHSESLDIVGNNTPSCEANEGGDTLNVKYLRTFTLGDFGLNQDFEIAEVTFGVEALNTSADMTVNLYTLEGELVFANLTLIGTTTETLSAQDLTLVTVPMTATAPAGSTLVVEIEVPSLVDVGGRFFAGSNSEGETAPSYVASPGPENCGIDEPTTMADLGFPDTHLVVTVAGTVDCGMPEWLTMSPLGGSVPSDGSVPVTLTFDAAGLEAGAHIGSVCVASNDPRRSLLLVPMDLTVLGSGLALDPSSVDLGDVEVGTSSPPETVLLQSVGAIEASGLSFEILGDDGFDADTSGCSTTLPVGEQCEIRISFAPPVPGRAVAVLQATSGDGAVASASLAGRGLNPTAVSSPVALAVDPAELVSDGNGVLEPGELVEAVPSWRNDGPTLVSLTGTAAEWKGPEEAAYDLELDAADYGGLAPGETESCLNTGVCYALGVGAPAGRPAKHWDATFEETLSDESATTWRVHVGDSFTDVPRTSPFYGAVESLLHSGVTGGCSDSEYCPDGANSRSQMPIFVLRALEGADYEPPACTEGATEFTDVPATNPFCSWIEELARRQVVSGCGGGVYCPGDPVTRAQMAIFLLKALEGDGYTPIECTGRFDDVPCSSLFADWIEDLAAREITGGCSAIGYCPGAPVTRAQMAVFITRAFGLRLYGP